MNTYELTFMLADEKEVKAIQTAIKTLDGKVVSEKAWGERELAYSIGKSSKAFYYTWSIKLDSSKVSELKEKINFSEKCMRYLLITSDEE